MSFPDTLREAIARRLPNPERRHEFTFILNWDPCSFPRLRGYGQGHERSLGEFTTITGEETAAIVMTAERYLKSQWPVFGPALLEFMKQVVSVEPQRRNPVRWSTGNTGIVGYKHEGDFHVEVIGTPGDIMRVGEPLVWLAAAFRSTPPGFNVMTVTPVFSDRGFLERAFRPLPALDCAIGFGIKPVDQANHPDAAWWHRLFPDTVVVKGYPVRRRIHSVLRTGLEIDLLTMINQLGINSTTMRNNRIFIEGTTAQTLVASHVHYADNDYPDDDNFVVWCLCTMEDGTQVPVNDTRIPVSPYRISFDIVKNRATRHIIEQHLELKPIAN
ncbi:hypothetical protein BO78DRAFT_389831 [Aspergillus sclerotiicarbonarius CBS 121057]|uniref:Uncharacterized protein n=1 Tax=Aspergillus sclerotiicarbonarius (strain CBS 121057 / IBT 28362) TaxID=1448318 RepID=A0A319EQ74_ASPSB|nr:hypothetical protein BO78DRAFT_389831 [Aspergillus sclerotiicarbonarius CBS 121057]